MVALWSSLRAALGGAANGEVLASGDEPEGHAALRDEKKSLLRAMKDLEYEHTVGKISDDDFQRLDAAYRVRAKEVLSLLDRDFAPYRSKAEAILAEAAGLAPKASSAKATEEPPAAIHDADAALRQRARELREEAERLEQQLAQKEPASEPAAPKPAVEPSVEPIAEPSATLEKESKPTTETETSP